MLWYLFNQAYGYVSYSSNKPMKCCFHTYHHIIHEVKFLNSKKKWSTSTQATLFTMRYYRFNRRRKNYLSGFSDYFKSQKKTIYMLNTDRSKKLDSFFLDNQVWGALHKCWKGYTIAKNKDEYDKMELYARRIQECQHDLGLVVSSFPNIGMSAASFFWQLAQEENDSQELQAAACSEENYLGDSQYERERFTDSYSEDFEDDENKADRFTDTYHENFTD